MKRKNSQWIISFAELIWGKDLINRYLDPRRAKPKAEGQKRLPLTPRKVRAMESKLCYQVAK